MPAPPLSNTLDGGTNGADITAANSGGTSGDAFDLAATAGTTTLTYDNTVALGALSAALTFGATPGSTYRGWGGLGSITGAVFYRVYMNATANPTATIWPFRLMDGAGVRTCEIALLTAGTFRLYNSAGASTGATTSVSMSLTGWFRVEWMFHPAGAADNQFKLRLYNDPDAAVGDFYGTEVVATGASATFGANQNQFRWGVNSGAAGGANQVIRFDNFAVSTTDWIGPVGGASGATHEKTGTGLIGP